MLLTIIGILVLLWIIGLLAHIAGAFIHILLIVALIVFIYRQLQGRKKA